MRTVIEIKYIIEYVEHKVKRIGYRWAVYERNGLTSGKSQSKLFTFPSFENMLSDPTQTFAHCCFFVTLYTPKPSCALDDAQEVVMFVDLVARPVFTAACKTSIVPSPPLSYVLYYNTFLLSIFDL